METESLNIQITSEFRATTERYFCLDTFPGFVDSNIDNCVRFCSKREDIFSTISSLFDIEKHLNDRSKEIKSTILSL